MYVSYGQSFWQAQRTGIPYKDVSMVHGRIPPRVQSPYCITMALLSITLTVAHVPKEPRL